MTDDHLFSDGVALKRRFKNKLASALMIAAFFAAAIPLVVVIMTVIREGIGIISIDWFTKDIPTNVAQSSLAEKFGVKPEAVVYGMKPAIIGTLIVTALATLMSVPIGILAAVYLHEYGGQSRFAKIVRFFSDVMVGVPSVVMGIFVYTTIVIRLGTNGRAAWVGAIALACLMLPVIVRTTEEMLRLVPDSLRQGSDALGAPKWKTIVKVVLPAAIGGITSGVMLAVARAAGETAPLLFTIGSVTAVNYKITGQSTALATQIYAHATQPGGSATAWGSALTLIALVLLLTTIARAISGRFAIDGSA